MKRLISLAVALVMIVACCFTASAETMGVQPYEDGEGPTSYLWLKTEDINNATTINFLVTPDDLNGGLGTYRIFADVLFENIVVNGGSAYVNIYFWGDEAQTNLLDFKDWAQNSTEGVVEGVWANMDYEFTCPEGFDHATVGIGCWNATGTVSIGTINISENKEMIYNVSFAGGLDLESEKVAGYTNISLDNQEINWGVVVPENEGTGKVNLALNKEAYIFGGPREGDEKEAAYQGLQYTGELTDGVIASKDFVPEYFGFHATTNVEAGGELNGETGSLGRVMIDFGEAIDFNQARLHYYGPLDNDGGIGNVRAMAVFYSDDGENWELFGDLIYDTESDYGWGDTGEKDTINAQYVLFEYLFAGGPWGMVSEIEVLSPELIEDDPDESSEPAEESKEESKEASKEESKTPVTPKTGDAGMIALAIVSVITLAGVVVVKNRK